MSLFSRGTPEQRQALQGLHTKDQKEVRHLSTTLGILLGSNLGTYKFVGQQQEVQGINLPQQVKVMYIYDETLIRGNTLSRLFEFEGRVNRNLGLPGPLITDFQARLTTLKSHGQEDLTMPRIVAMINDGTPVHVQERTFAPKALAHHLAIAQNELFAGREQGTRTFVPYMHQV